MRIAFLNALTELAERDERVFLLTGDLGLGVIDGFKNRFPDRFVNVGVAEQNMIGIATGMAAAGYVPYVYSIATFATLRGYEFIRNGPCFHGLPVRIIGVGAGLDAPVAGITHVALDDVAAMRAQPNMSIIVPADYAQAKTALHATAELEGPVYYRLGNDPKTLVPELNGRFEVGRVQLLREGTDRIIFAMGPVAREAIEAAELCGSKGISCAVAVVASVRPVPRTDLVDLLARYPVALSVEEHYADGGLGSLLCELAAEEGTGTRVRRCAVATAPPNCGSTQYMRRKFGLAAESLLAHLV